MPIVDHTENIIEVKHVSFAYGETEVLKDITLNIHRGDYLGIVGSNGSGKTTLLKIILGLLTPSSGSVTLFGKDPARFSDRSKIGYVPQMATHFDAKFPATVQEIALMGRYARRGLFHRITAEDRAKTRRALEQVDLSDQTDRLIGELSSGQQQRVFIARALAAEPEILFLDEPTTGVDQAAKDEFYALLKRLNQELHLTVVLITHDIEGVAYEAMHIACLDRTLFFHNSLDEYVKETRSKRVAGKIIEPITHRHSDD